MTARARFSAQTLTVLAALCSDPACWQHGYALAKHTGLKSGTLCPILIRLADRHLVQAQWQGEPEPGRPRRHLYRLTAEGEAAAAAALADARRRAAVGRPAVRPRGGRPVASLAGNGPVPAAGPARAGAAPWPG